MTQKAKRTLVDFFSNHNMRVFLVCLLITAVVWVLMSLSETKSMRYSHPLKFSGYDRNRYAIQADTAITLEITGTGFELLKTLAWKTPPAITVDLSGRKYHLRNSMATADLEKSVLAQLNLYDNQKIRFMEDSIVFFLNKRASKTVAVDIANVDFEFAPQYGIYGAFVVTPDSITLYGDSNSLGQVDKVGVEKVRLHNIDADSTYTIPLQPVWKQYSDLYPSARYVKVHIPVQRFTEATYTVPIAFVYRDTTVHAKVYPPNAVITCKVALKDYKRITASDFETVVSCQSLHQQDTLPVEVSRFPQHVRISKINPEHVQYVVIK